MKKPVTKQGTKKQSHCVRNSGDNGSVYYIFVASYLKMSIFHSVILTASIMFAIITSIANENLESTPLIYLI